MSDETADPEPPEHFKAAVTDAVDPFTRFFKNLERVSGFVVLYGSLRSAKVPLPDKVQTDILRSAIVFMHATLEELLRELAVSFLPLADEESLNAVPLAGSQTGARAEKFFLGRLAKYRGRSVDEVLQQSVREHLASSNYNDVGELDRLLCALRMDCTETRSLYPNLADMMMRRHQIVHRADVAAGAKTLEAAELAPEDVSKWLEALTAFARHVTAKAVMRHLIDRRVLEVVDGKMRIPAPT